MLTLTTQQVALLLHLVRETAAGYVNTIQHKPDLSNPELDADILEALADTEAALLMSLAPVGNTDEQLH